MSLTETIVKDVMKYDLLHIQGKPYVLVPLHDYRAMVSGDHGDNIPDEILDQLTARQESSIKVLRKFRGFTQAELAKRAKISRTYLTEIETGKKDGSIRAIKAIAKALDTDVGRLT